MDRYIKNLGNRALRTEILTGVLSQATVRMVALRSSIFWNASQLKKNQNLHLSNRSKNHLCENFYSLRTMGMTTP
jgi:hypothetical protein